VVLHIHVQNHSGCSFSVTPVTIPKGGEVA